VCGHIHEAPVMRRGSFIDRLGDTILLNAGQTSEKTHPSPNHIIFDTEQNTVVWHSEARAPIHVALADIPASPDPDLFADGPDQRLIAHRDKLPR